MSNDQEDVLPPAEDVASPEESTGSDADDFIERVEAAIQRPAPDRATVKRILEGALLASGETLNIVRFGTLFEDYERPDEATIRELLGEIATEYIGRGIELKEVASGFRIQVNKDLGPWVSRLWTEKPPRYSRALLETLSLIAYRQPITRGEIEEIRGVAVSSDMVKSLMERDWIRVVGHRDVPGRPALYATTHEFLDYFNLKSLDELPTLAELRDLDKMNQELHLDSATASAVLAAERSAAGDDSEQPRQYLIGEDAEPADDLDIGMDMNQVDEVLKRVEDSFRRKDDDATPGETGQ